MEILIGIIFISTLGTLLHFTYDISKHNKIIGLFSAVNESTWEHIKMALTAAFIWSIYDGYLYGTNPNYFIAKVISLVIIIVLMPLIFYTYTSILKRNYLFIDICSFYITIIASQLIMAYLLRIDSLGTITNYIGALLLFILFGFYLTATLMPLKSFIFKDPLTNKYGFMGHKK